MASIKSAPTFNGNIFTMFTIYNSYFIEKPHGIDEIDLKCKGMGTEKDPIIIEPSKNIPQIFALSEYKRHVVIRNLNARYIGLFNCKNILIENSFFKKLILNKCDNIKIQNCSINKIKVKESNNRKNIIQNCTINRTKEKFLEGLTLENTIIEEIEPNFSIKYFFINNKREIIFNSITLIVIIILFIIFHFWF